MSFSTTASRSRKVFLDCGDTMITKQSCKDECDINKILSQYQKTGILTHIRRSSADYSALPLETDYQKALNTVIEADNAFAQLPSKVRDRFGNNPAQLLAALNNPANRDELIGLGLLDDRRAAPAKPSSPAADPAA